MHLTLTSPTSYIKALYLYCSRVYTIFSLQSLVGCGKRQHPQASNSFSLSWNIHQLYLKFFLHLLFLSPLLRKLFHPCPFVARLNEHASLFSLQCVGLMVPRSGTVCPLLLLYTVTLFLMSNDAEKPFWFLSWGVATVCFFVSPAFTRNEPYCPRTQRCWGKGLCSSSYLCSPPPITRHCYLQASTAPFCHSVGNPKQWG